MPKLLAFVQQTMDVYSGSGSSPPPAGNLRTTAVDCLICGTPLEGTRTRQFQGYGFTHIILCDPKIEIRDGYIGNNAAPTTALADFLKIPSGVANWWMVIFSCIILSPTMGWRKLIMADRRTAPGDWTKLT